jgi:signal transduction histidine kinase
VDDVLQNFRHPLSEREFKVEVEMPVDLPPRQADRTAMILTIDNLIDNAIRYSPREHFIRVSAWREGRTSSSKCRIAAWASRRKSCRSSDAVRTRLARADGAALTAIVSRIVADHRGTLVLDSESDKGTTAKAVYL